MPVRLKTVIFGIVCFVALCAGIVSLPIVAQKLALSSRIEADYREFKASGKDELFTWYPELLDRIADDLDLARTVTAVHLTGPQFDVQDYSALARFPNLKHIEVSYGTSTDSFVSTLNGLVTVDSVALYYCGLTEMGLEKLASETLTEFESHDFSAEIPDTAEIRARERLPGCDIRITRD